MMIGEKPPNNCQCSSYMQQEAIFVTIGKAISSDGLIYNDYYTLVCL